MNSAEITFWGTRGAITGFLEMVRRPDERPARYDSRHSYEFAVALAEELGDAGETLLAELLKMKRAADDSHATEEADLELVAG